MAISSVSVGYMWLPLWLYLVSELEIFTEIPLHAVFFNYIRRIFKNIFDHAEQISKVRLFLSFLVSLT